MHAGCRFLEACMRLEVSGFSLQVFQKSETRRHARGFSLGISGALRAGGRACMRLYVFIATKRHPTSQSLPPSPFGTFAYAKAFAYALRDFRLRPSGLRRNMPAQHAGVTCRRDKTSRHAKIHKTMERPRPRGHQECPRGRGRSTNFVESRNDFLLKKGNNYAECN